ncbi:hypothetical protein C0214_00245 [Methylobacterium sp. DM1]|nr:hypothetical protein C0214_00245 [Methylobacterium sp. DM1]
MATHRLRYGNFGDKGGPGLLAFPIVGGVGGAIHEPVNITLYQPPNDVLTATTWPFSVVSSNLRVVHGDSALPAASNQTASVLVASEEGIAQLSRPETGGPWRETRLSAGETQSTRGTLAEWKGSGDVDVGRIGTNPMAYIVALEPFHGASLVIYTKAADARGEDQWQRHLLDRFDHTTAATAEGPGHHVLTGDFDGDGDDEFLVALRGPAPYSGVFYYKVRDIKNLKVNKQRVSSASASRLAAADFNRDGRLDFASVPYVVATYYRAEDARVMVYINQFANRKQMGSALPTKP